MSAGKIRVVFQHNVDAMNMFLYNNDSPPKISSQLLVIAASLRQFCPGRNLAPGAIPDQHIAIPGFLGKP